MLRFDFCNFISANMQQQCPVIELLYFPVTGCIGQGYGQLEKLQTSKALWIWTKCDFLLCLSFSYLALAQVGLCEVWYLSEKSVFLREFLFFSKVLVNALLIIVFNLHLFLEERLPLPVDLLLHWSYFISCHYSLVI